MKSLLPILTIIILLIPLRAQTTDTAPPDNNAGSVTIPAPPRNIMPQTLNHKPNPVQPPAEIAASVDKFFGKLKTGDYVNAYDTFLAGTRLGEQTEKKSAMISRTQEAFGLYGKFHDYEIYDNYSVGSNVLILTYLSRHDIQPLRWRFIYYRPDKSWGLINMGFDDFLLDLLD